MRTSYTTSPRAPDDTPLSREGLGAFPLASLAELKAWPALTPVARSALEWAQGKGVGQAQIETPALLVAARAWARLVRQVHALLTHPDLVAPPGSRWKMEINPPSSAFPLGSAAAPLTWTVCLGPLSSYSPHVDDVARIPSLRDLFSHPGLRFVPEDFQVLSPFWWREQPLPEPGLSDEAIGAWWCTVESASPALAPFSSAARAGELAAALPTSTSTRARSGPRL